MAVHVAGGPVNPWEQAGRARKAQNIAATIWTLLTPEERLDMETPFDVQEKGAEWWAERSVRAGHNDPPSAETRAEIVLAVARLVNAERRFGTDVCEACEGGGTESARYTGEGDSYLDGERPCSDCKGSGLSACEACREKAGNVSTPNGRYCPTCTQKTFPTLVPGAAAARMNRTASRVRERAG